LDMRLRNAMNLAFHCVTQDDSSSMRIIATLTLLYLPGSTIAAIFGTEFFKYERSADGTESFRVSRAFFLFWLFAIPVSLLTVLFSVFSSRGNWRQIRYQPKYRWTRYYMSKYSQLVSLRPESVIRRLLGVSVGEPQEDISLDSRLQGQPNSSV